jgi:tetratricopeptide (TPR) repeat protein
MASFRVSWLSSPSLEPRHGRAYHQLVGTTPAHDLIVAGREAVRAGDFETAARSLEAALAIEPSPEAYDLLAYLGYAEDDFEAARRRWELAYHGYLAAGDLRGAGRAAVHLASTLYDGFLDEEGSRKWLGRAGELLNQAGRCVERGYLALALVACHVRDAHALEQSAVVALELAQEFGDPDLEARARADRGLAFINQGRIVEGFDQLDEAMAAIVAGAVSPLFSGTIFCAMLSACERTGDLKRAEEWSRTARIYLDRTCGDKVPILHSHCRTAYGVVLCDTGRWTEAEVEILYAFGPNATKAVSKQADAAGALARLRLMQGRLDEVFDLLAPYAGRFEVCEQLAQLHMLRDEPDQAADILNRGLHDLIGDRLRAGRLLELLVEVELARDHPDGAELALERLEACALASESPVLRAAVSLSEGRIAMYRSHWESAVVALNEALDVLGTEERPIMAGRIRLELATALAHTSADAMAVDQARNALAIFERLGARRDTDKAVAVLDSLAAVSNAGDVPRAPRGIEKLTS